MACKRCSAERAMPSPLRADFIDRGIYHRSAHGLNDAVEQAGHRGGQFGRYPARVSHTVFHSQVEINLHRDGLRNGELTHGRDGEGFDPQVDLGSLYVSEKFIFSQEMRAGHKNLFIRAAFCDHGAPALVDHIFTFQERQRQPFVEQLHRAHNFQVI
jgi:hypothetical protein